MTADEQNEIGGLKNDILNSQTVLDVQKEAMGRELLNGQGDAFIKYLKNPIPPQPIRKEGWFKRIIRKMFNL